MHAKRYFTLCVAVLISTFLPSAASNFHMNFNLKRNHRVLSGGTKINQVTRKGMTPSLCAVFCGTSCHTFHSSHTTGVCSTFSDRFYIYDQGLMVTSDPQWVIGYKSPLMDDWALAFRAQKEINASVYNLWNKESWKFDNTVTSTFPKACLDFVNYEPCDRHFRSWILSKWENIKEVRLSLFKSNSEVVYVVFNGTGSTKLSWFTPARIIASPWSPKILEETLTVPSIKGSCGATICRRFLLFGRFQSCQVDWFYMFTVDNSYETCIEKGFWPIVGNVVNSYPMFFYSKTSGRASLANNEVYPYAESADVLAVWVKFA
ncbi:hypothetical protein RRG08_066969 [Elysia crispata]|uniref:Uncharacterized protein n=1 Tax=Elysia crispata TaxID=231223 RepID=A0AAE1DCG7_9GAST|nr:hypothetical protein RRG08_066969 [Elysia crispata]